MGAGSLGTPVTIRPNTALPCRLHKGPLFLETMVGPWPPALVSPGNQMTVQLPRLFLCSVLIQQDGAWESEFQQAFQVKLGDTLV